MKLPWYLAAFGAALVWGVHYPLIDNALRKVSLPAVLLLTALPIVAVTPFWADTLADDWRTLAALPWRERLPIVALALTSLTATILLFVSIGGSNATLASLIEITYPVFVALFAFLLFREVQVNASVAVGGLLVFVGVTLIILEHHGHA